MVTVTGHIAGLPAVTNQYRQLTGGTGLWLLVTAMDTYWPGLCLLQATTYWPVVTATGPLLACEAGV